MFGNSGSTLGKTGHYNEFKMADDSELPLNVTYKELQERFVSDLNGTSLLEIGIVASTAPAAVLLRTFVFGVLFSKVETKFSKWLFYW